jgi:hypothetical protein
MHLGWIVSLILIVFIVLIKFVPFINRLFCNNPDGILGFKYKKSNNKDANEVVDNINNFLEIFQKKNMPCSGIDDKDLAFPGGVKCEHIKIFVTEFIKVNVNDKDATKFIVDFTDKLLKKLCLPDGTVDPVKFLDMFKSMYKMFCV